MKNIGSEFMEKTKYKNLESSDQSKGITQPPLEMEYDPNSLIIDLPSPKKLDLGKKNLVDIIGARRSLRNYSEVSLSLEELSFLLWCTQGVQRVTAGTATLRTVPSAGARHAFETYLLINNVDRLDPGVYRYIALEHKLVFMDLGIDISE